MKDENRQVEPLDMDLIHQEATHTLPEDLAEALTMAAAQKAAEAGISLNNPMAEPGDNKTPDNKVLLQSFEWYLPDDGQHYKQLAEKAGEFADLGIGGIWLPPPCKATGTNDVGYGVYDLWDLGEFDQKGSVRTKYGTLPELKACIRALQEQGLQVYADVVLNHKAGADEAELFSAVRVDPDNRSQAISEPYDIRG